jgi:quinolinate synthase
VACQNGYAKQYGGLSTDELSARVRELARERNAVILAHNYQVPEIQDVADYVGDSLGLSRQAASTEADVILFCGVHFMAETAAILSPDKTVLLPDLEAGCSLAATITANDLRRWKAEYPGAVVVSYVNTTAEVKALSDYCCTSGNAEAIINSIPEDREILFLPDMFLGAYLERKTGRKMHIWMGECHVHAGIDPADIGEMRVKNPDSDFLIHPECGCVTQTMYRLGEGDIASNGQETRILSTEGMVRHAQSSPRRRFVVATETGILHRLRKEAPGKEFIAASPGAVCQFMKRITLPKALWALENLEHRITVPADIAAQARGAIDRMVAIA